MAKNAGLMAARPVPLGPPAGARTDEVPIIAGESVSEFLANQDEKNSEANQRRNQSTDDQRNNPILTIDRLRPSALLRRPYAQPEEKFVHWKRRGCWLSSSNGASGFARHAGLVTRRSPSALGHPQQWRVGRHLRLSMTAGAPPPSRPKEWARPGTRRPVPTSSSSMRWKGKPGMD